MVKNTLHLFIDVDLTAEAKRRGINLSKEFEDHLRRVIDYKDEFNIQAEEMKIEKKKLQLEHELQKLNEVKEKRQQRSELLTNPLIIESLKIVKEAPHTAKGRSSLIKNKLNVVISPEELLEMAEKIRG